MFKTSRSLLNPKFEGYKLDAVVQQDSVTRFPLQFKPTQATVSTKTPFSFQEVQSRITHNHLATCNGSQNLLYVDSESKVVMIDINPDTMSPSFRVIFELPASVQSANTQPKHHEYPSSAFISPTLVFVADGRGLMYALEISNNSSSESLGVFSLPGNSAGLPFRIHSVHLLSPATSVLVLSSRNYDAKQEGGTQSTRKSKPAAFDVWGVKVSHIIPPHNDVRQLDVLWHRRGQGVPVYTTYSESLRSFLLLGETNYHQVDHVPAPLYEPSSDELAPIPRPGENLDENAEPVKPPPPFSWTQTSDSVTIAIPLPSSTPKSTIKVEISPTTLTFHVTNQLSTAIPIPEFSARKLWDRISPSSSYWTWDRESEGSFGSLTLYLDKQHEGTKWPQIFSQNTDSGDDVEVLETLDPSELWHAREALEKYTAALRDGEDASGLGLGRGVPSLADGEFDMEVDETVGRSVHLSWIGEEGMVPSWYKDTEDIPIQLLSTPIPGIDGAKVSLVTRNGIDGTLFKLEALTSRPAWTHTSTFSALSFVLASKQDTRFTFHSSKAVFALEGGSKDRGGNIYVYYSASPNENWAKQTILKVGSGDHSSLLGVGAIITGSDAALICLTEGELVIIRTKI